MSLCCAGIHWDSARAILEQCQSCRESNTGLYWDSTEVYWHNKKAIVGQC